MDLNDQFGTCEFTTTVGKVLGLCSTRWTCHAESLGQISQCYFAQFKAFVHIMTTKEEHQKLNTEHKNEIVSMITKKQHFEFCFGLQLSIVVFGIIDHHATVLQ